MTELEKLEAGEPYDFLDCEVAARKDLAIRKCAEYNAIDPLDSKARWSYLYDWFGSFGESSWGASTFSCDCGKNIFMGKNLTVNFNVTILDIRRVEIGDNTMIGPGTLICTVNHPLSPAGRRKHQGIAKPVKIGRDVWIGGNAVILPGVTIGNNVVVAAGAVVTKDVPDNTLVGGVPARKIRDLVNDLGDDE